MFGLLIAAQDDGDDSIDVGDIDLAVTIHVGSCGITISSQDDGDDGIDISNIDLAVAIHVAGQSFRD